MVRIICAIIVAVLCAFAYRFGGISKEEGQQKYPWAPTWLFRSWVRDVFCSLIPLFYLRIFYPYVHPSAYGTTFVLSWAAHSTYYDKIFGYDNFWAHGAGIGVAYFLFAIFSGLWIGFILRVLLMTVLMGSASALSEDADVEEYARGAATGITLPLMFIQ